MDNPEMSRINLDSTPMKGKYIAMATQAIAMDRQVTAETEVKDPLPVTLFRTKITQELRSIDIGIHQAVQLGGAGVGKSKSQDQGC